MVNRSHVMVVWVLLLILLGWIGRLITLLFKLAISIPVVAIVAGGEWLLERFLDGGETAKPVAEFEQTVGYFQKLRFFLDQNGTPLPVDQVKAMVQARTPKAFDGEDISDPVILDADPSRFFTIDETADPVGPGSHAEFFRALGRISRGTLEFERLEETKETGETRIHVRLYRGSDRVYVPDADSRGRDLRLVSELNALIGSTGYRFHRLLRANKRLTLVCLSEREHAQLDTERGWYFKNLPSC